MKAPPDRICIAATQASFNFSEQERFWSARCVLYMRARRNGDLPPPGPFRRFFLSSCGRARSCARVREAPNTCPPASCSRAELKRDSATPEARLQPCLGRVHANPEARFHACKRFSCGSLVTIQDSLQIAWHGCCFTDGRALQRRPSPPRSVEALFSFCSACWSSPPSQGEAASRHPHRLLGAVTLTRPRPGRYRYR